MKEQKKETTTYQEVNRDNVEYRSDRFEFVLSINDNIVVQRFFKIFGYNPLSLYTSDLKDAIDDIVALIDEDLKSKSRTYMYYGYTDDYEFEEYDIKPFDGVGESYVGDSVTEVSKIVDLGLTRLADKVVLTNPEKVIKTVGNYDKPKDVNGVKTYLHNYENQLKFEFKVDKETVISKIWSGDVYPVFVRSNIDITNKRLANVNPNDRRLSKEASLVRRMVRYEYDENHESVTKNKPNSLIKTGSKDLIPIIINKICDVCSSERHYGLNQEFGDKTYGVNYFRSRETGEILTQIKPVSYPTKYE